MMALHVNFNYIRYLESLAFRQILFAYGVREHYEVSYAAFFAFIEYSHTQKLIEKNVN